MRPRPFGRGIVVMQAVRIRIDRASMRPRPFGRGIPHPARGAGGIPGASMRPRPFGRGITGRPGGSLAQLSASMRPRPFGRGIAPWPPRASDCAPRFNEAATFRPRNPRYSPARPPGGISFNEAATFRPRNRETLADVPGPLRASMRPRPFGRGIADAAPEQPKKGKLQ